MSFNGHGTIGPGYPRTQVNLDPGRGFLVFRPQQNYRAVVIEREIIHASILHHKKTEGNCPPLDVMSYLPVKSSWH